MSAGATDTAVGVKLVSHFATVEQQKRAAVLGMWAWLLTELLLFAGLFLTALILPSSSTPRRCRRRRAISSSGSAPPTPWC